MEEERLQEPEKAEIIRVEYEQPKLIHRVLANFIDILLMVLATGLCFIGSRAIVQATPMYRSNDYELRKIELDSGLFIDATVAGDAVIHDKGFDINEYHYGHEIKLYTSWLPKQERYTYEDIVSFSEKAITRFAAYMDNIKPSLGDEIITFVNNKKLEKTGKFAGHEHYFEKNNETNEIFIPKQESGMPYYSYKTYFDNFYRLIIDDNLVDDYLTKYAPKIKNYLSNEGKYLLLIEFPTAYFMGALLVYFIPPLFLRRGRRTLGKALYRIGLVDKNILSPTFVKHLLRFVIFFFAELVLSIFTFGIPYVISFTLMLKSKRKQGFPDYMLGLTEIDVSKQKIYYNKIEALSDKASVYKKPTDFKLPDNL